MTRGPRLRLSVGIALLCAAPLVSVGAPASGADRTQRDPYRDDQWGLDAIAAPDAWRTSTGRGAVVAVIDTGVDLGHPDLKGQLVGRGMDFVGTEKPKAAARDSDGHGTHVAGIVAARTGNGIGVSGTAPDAKVLPVRVCTTEGCTFPDIVEGMRYAIDKRVDVINLSLGTNHIAGRGADALAPEWRLLIEKAWKKGIVIVAAAGNDTLPLCGFPAYVDQVLCVGATERSGLLAWYSNFDATTLDNYLVAPGGQAIVTDCTERVWSLWLRRGPAGSCSGKPGYKGHQGTSMAAPFVSGVAALLSSQGATNEQIHRAILERTTDMGAPGEDPIYGNGLLNADAAVSSIGR